MADRIKFGLAVVLVLAGLVGYYQLSEHALVLRVLSVLGGVGAGALVAWFTQSGKRFYTFAREAVAETRRVTWPSRKETWQTTGVVFVLVVVMGIFLWLVDWGFLSIVQRLLGRSE